MTIAIKPTASGSTIEQDGSTILTVDGSGNIDVANNLTTGGSTAISNTPVVQAIMGANTSVATGVATLVPFSVEQIDTDNAYDNTTYTFTVPTGKAGMYFIYASTRADGGTSNVNNALMKVQKNGGDLARDYQNAFNNPVTALQLSISGCWNLAEGDEIKVYTQMATANAANGTLSAGTYNRLHIHKLIG